MTTPTVTGVNVNVPTASAGAVSVPSVTVNLPVTVGLPGEPGAAGGGLIPRVATGPVTAAGRDAVYVDATAGPVTVTLPAPILSAQVLVAKTDPTTHPVTVVAANGATVDSITIPQAASTYLADGTQWRIIMAYTPGAATGAAINALKSGYLSNITAKSAAYTAVAGDFVMATTTASFVVTGPAAPAAGAVVGIKKVSSDANTVTFTPASGTVDGAATFVVSTFEQENTFTYDGANWQVS